VALGTAVPLSAAITREQISAILCFFLIVEVGDGSSWSSFWRWVHVEEDRRRETGRRRVPGNRRRRNRSTDEKVGRWRKVWGFRRLRKKKKARKGTAHWQRKKQESRQRRIYRTWKVDR